MVNLSNVQFGVYCSEEKPINLRLHRLDRIKTGNAHNQLRITYEQCYDDDDDDGDDDNSDNNRSSKTMKPIEIDFFTRLDRDEFLQNIIEAQFIDKARCFYFYLPKFLLRSCCGLFRYNQLYVKKSRNTLTSSNNNNKYRTKARK